MHSTGAPELAGADWRPRLTPWDVELSPEPNSDQNEELHAEASPASETRARMSERRVCIDQVYVVLRRIRDAPGTPDRMAEEKMCV